MNIEPIVKRSISEEVADRIKRSIMEKQWLPGEKIPGEMELSRLFGVSRVTVREAIASLCGMGLLSTRRGEGTFVAEVLPNEYLNTLLPMLMIEGGSMDEILELRQIIEVESVGFAALRADENDVLAMEKIIARMEDYEGHDEEFAEADLAFHTAVAAATHNGAVVKVISLLHDMLQSAMEEIIKIMGYSKGLYFHKQILEAIKDKDVKKAKEMMRNHIEETVKSVKTERK
jgi:GntR family transcriptional repressor for pyruvate dehydrogenase complex